MLLGCKLEDLLAKRLNGWPGPTLTPPTFII